MSSHLPHRTRCYSGVGLGEIWSIERYPQFRKSSRSARADVFRIACFGGLQPLAGTEFAVLGDIFLKSQYVVFNQSPSPMIGFAAKPL